MKMKKSIVLIFALIIMILLMMTIKAQAATVGKVYDLTSKMQGNIVYFSWSKVANADGYDLYINTSNKGYEYIGSVTGTEVPVIGFQENETYLAKVCAYELNNDGTKERGNFSKAIQVDTETESILDKVTTLTATQNGGNITLNWSKVTNADGYQIFVDISGFGYINIGSVTSTTAIITGFKDGETYGFKVRAYENITSETLNYGGFSPSKTLKINDEKYEDDEEEYKEITKLAKVTRLSIDEVVENQAYISWNKVSDADGYEIWLKKGTGSYVHIDDVYKRSAVLSDLSYETTYRVKVRAFTEEKNGRNYGEYSSVVKFTTEEEEIVLTTVTNLEVSVKNKNQAKLSWSSVEGADGYIVYLSEDGGNFTKADIVNNNNYTTLKNLEYNTNYKVKVIAFRYEDGAMACGGSFSSVKSFKTEKKTTSEVSTEGNEEVPQVKNVRANVVGSTVYLSWNEVKGAVKYEIDFTVPGLGGSTKFTVYTNSRAISGITNKKFEYTARVRAYKWVDGKLVAGPYSSVSKFTGK